MQPTLLDIEHRHAVWTEQRRSAGSLPPRARDRRRAVARALVALAARLDREVARTSLAARNDRECASPGLRRDATRLA
jgi:hypothetical protein